MKSKRSRTLHPLEARVLRELPHPGPTRLFIAYSGGRDSTVLLHSCRALQRQDLLPAVLVAWHINHRLLPQSDEWEAHCVEKCRALGLRLRASRLHIRRHANESMEMAARRERYAVWERELPADCLLLQAHHERDQAETLLLRLFRGSRSLSAMPQRRPLGKGLLHRPLLRCPAADLVAYQKDESLEHIEDASNQDLTQDRNFVRHSVLPLLARRWPRLEPSLAETAERLETSALGLELLKQRLLDEHIRDDKLALTGIRNMKPSVFEFLIRSWLETLRLPLASAALIRQTQRQAWARPDATPSLIWEGAEIHRYDGFLYAMPPLPIIRKKDDGFIIRPARNRRNEYPLRLGSLIIRKTGPNGGEMRVDYRRGGERLRLKTGSRPLKKLLQEQRIPPWLRPYMPLVYCDKELIAVPHLGKETVLQHESGLKADWRVDAVYGAPRQRT